MLLTDFGIAKGLDSSGDDLTSDNVMMGTAKYLSPEQVRGRRLDGRADLYSLGLVLYECLAGRVPFLGETDADTALARLQRDPTDLGRLRPTLPIGLVNLIHRAAVAQPRPPPASRAPSCAPRCCASPTSRRPTSTARSADAAGTASPSARPARCRHRSTRRPARGSTGQLPRTRAGHACRSPARRRRRNPVSRRPTRPHPDRRTRRLRGTPARGDLQSRTGRR